MYNLTNLTTALNIVPGGRDLGLVLGDDPLPRGLHLSLLIEEAGVEETLQGLELGFGLGVLLNRFISQV